jgi:cob(I)alamin adenosyltransferase
LSISTKTGDGGSTSLLFNKRVSKNHPRVVCYGNVDELSSSLGICRAHSIDVNVKSQLLEIQIELVHFMAELATDDLDQDRYLKKYADKVIHQQQVDRLTSLIEEKEKNLQFKGWTQSGETVADAFFDQARTTCRRAERGIVALKESGTTVRSELMVYLNRLADLLWIWGVEHMLSKK